MAAKKTKQNKKSEDTGKEKRKRFSFLSSMTPEKKVRLFKFLGLAAGMFTVCTFVFVVSYLFTWSADQSLLSNPDMMDKNVDVANAGSKLGYRWSRFLVEQCFGLGSFAVIFLFGAISYRLFYPEKSIGLARLSILSLSGAFILSLILSFFSSLVCADTFFGGGLGGDAASAVVAWIKNLVGPLGTGLFLLVVAVAWLIFASRRFAEWFGHLGEKKPEAENAEVAVSAENDDVPAAETLDAEYFEAETPADEPFMETDELPVDDMDDEPFGIVGPEDSEDGPKSSDNLNAGNKDIEVLPVNNDDKDKEDVPMEVIMKDNINTEVIEDLPRIDNRQELERYQFPPLDLLDDYSSGKHMVSQQELETNNNRIRATLMNYRVEVVRVTAVVGPTVTLYKVVPAPGVKVSSIENLHREIAMALGAKGVRVVTLSDCVGIEVPNSTPTIVPLKAMLNSDAFRNSKAELPVALGYTITQDVKTFDLTDAPHLLIAGATKQGKSVGLNVIISSLLYAKHPSELKFVFIDPKVVEFTAYKSLLKHYLAVLPLAADEKEEAESAIINSPKQADQVLNSLCIEMDQRYNLLKLAGVNDLKLYNEKYKDRKLLPTEGHKYLPYLVVVIDEYADLTMSGGAGSDARKAAKQIEASIVRLAQKGRAAGIHVIIATQRPSVNVITGLIKANFPTRIAFRVTSRIDSNTILDTSGAENLIGKGDMLYYAGVDIDRVQCALVSMKEINRITDFISSQKGFKQCYNTPYYLPVPEAQDGEPGGGNLDMSNIDSMFEDAARMVVSTQKGSTSDLQRRLGMGYARAGRVMDQLEAAGIVGPQEGSKPRKVLVSFEELDEIIREFVKE
ncbi:MAG: DNA translocase FtsK [Candidatus Cryptobacteroides sp.]